MAGGERECVRCEHEAHGDCCELACSCEGCPVCEGTGYTEIYDGGLDAWAEVRCGLGCEVAS